jgi:hypothetical protein
MSSPEFQSQFTPQERGMLSNVLSIEPYEYEPNGSQFDTPPAGRE